MEAPVTILVVAYNSARTIKETLDSIFVQSWPRLELVVTDDGSVDDTVMVCESWMAEYGTRFERMEIVRCERNTGISPNVNRGYKACRTEWIKPIAADDILMPMCIEVMMEAVKERPEGRFFFSQVEVFGSALGNPSHTDDFWRAQYVILRRGYDARQQYYYLRYFDNFLPASSLFVHLPTLKKLGYTDESILFLEDYPLWLKATKHGFRLEFVDRPTVMYRVSEASVQWFNPKFDLSILLVYDKYKLGNVFYQLFTRWIDQMNPTGRRTRLLMRWMWWSELPARVLFKINRFRARNICNRSRS